MIVSQFKLLRFNSANIYCNNNQVPEKPHVKRIFRFYARYLPTPKNNNVLRGGTAEGSPDKSEALAHVRARARNIGLFPFWEFFI